MQQREQWGSRVGFMLAAIGSAIGLGNIWRFPYMAYDNGGGAFLVPYLFALVTTGIPFMVLEFGLGQRFRGSAPRVFASLRRRWEWIGWMQVLVALVISVYYVVVIGWTLNYTWFALTRAWGDDPKRFFFGDYLGLTGSPLVLGGFRPPILLACVAAWVITWLACTSGVRRGIERACKVLIPLLFLLVLVLIARVVTLPGAGTGLDFLFRPDFSRLADMDVWADAYGQIFLSLSVGYAIMLAYSSYLPKGSDINNNATMTVFINCGFSLLSGIMIFAVLGSMAHETGLSVHDVAGEGVGLAFVTIPAAINALPAPALFGTLFFLCLAMGGVSSHISLVEAVCSAFIDKFGWSRKATAGGVCLSGLLASLVLTTGGGLLILDIVDHFINNICILGLALTEMTLVSYVVGLEETRLHVNAHSDFALGRLWKLALQVVTVPVLGYVFVMNLAADLSLPYGGYAARDLLLLGWSLLPMFFTAALVLKGRRPVPDFIADQRSD